MKFDSNLAWKQASASIGANREVLLALAGVFFLLPSLAFALFFPTPEPAPGQSSEQAAALLTDYFSMAMPAILPMAMVQAAGTLAILTLFTDKSQPMVGQAIKQGFLGMLSYFASQLLLGVGIGLLGGIAIAMGAATGVAVIAALLLAAVGLFALYAWIKTSLVAPVIAVERVLNPIAALRRSWRLTKGNSARIGLFYLLLGIALFMILGVVMIVVGLILAAVADEETAKILSAVVSSALGAIMTLYFVAVLAAVHRQLAGPSADVVAAPFE